MKRIIAFILALATCFGMVGALSGCSNDKNDAKLTRSQWVSELSSQYNINECYDRTPIFTDVNSSNSNFNKIQACSEWNIVEKSDKFNPDEIATNKFAIVSAVKAIGLDKIEKSEKGTALKSDDEICEFFRNNGGSDITYKMYLDKELTASRANEILQISQQIQNNLTLVQKQDIKYTDAVKEMELKDINFSADGETAIIKGNVSVGDIIVVKPNEYLPTGKYIKVRAEDANVITYEEAKMEEVFDHVVIQGTYIPEALGAIPLTEGVQITSIGGKSVEPMRATNNNPHISNMVYMDNSEIMPLSSVNLGDIEASINTRLSGEDGKSVELKGKIKVKDIKFTVDVDSWGPIIKSAYISADSKIEASVALEGQISKTFPLMKVPFTLFGCITASAEIDIKIGVEGTISLVFSVKTQENLSYKPFSVPKFNASASDPNLDIEIKAKAFVKPQFKVVLYIGPAALANVGVYSGFEASVKTHIGTSKDLGCIDINGFVPLAIFIGAEQKETLLGKLGVKYSWSFWTSSTSPVKKSWHIEDGKLVDKCTKKDKTESTTSNDNAISDPKEDVIDNDLIDFSSTAEDQLLISSYFVSMDIGKVDKLNVLHLPEGYSNNDIFFESSNPQIVSVDSSGTLKGVSEGTTLIKVITKDKKYIQFCAIRSLESYFVDFTPLV